MSPILAGISFLGAAGAFIALALYLRPSRFAVGAPRLRLRVAALGTAILALLAWAAYAGQIVDTGVIRLKEKAVNEVICITHDDPLTRELIVCNSGPVE